MAKTKTAADILNRAADELERHGWIQGKYGTTRGAKCIMGAIAFAGVGKIPTSPFFRWNLQTMAANKILETCTPPRWTAVAWNDRAGRTKEQVIRLLRRAAKKAEKK